LDKFEALRIARERGLDLVVIAKSADPPVAKILDYKKFLYQERKKASSSKSKSKKSELKELRFRPSTGEEDLRIRTERAREFLNEKNRVRLTVQLRGRERMYPEIGMEKIKAIVKSLEDIAKTEKPAQRNGNRLTVTLVAK